MHEPLDAGLQFHERTELGDPADDALHGGAHVILVAGTLPRALDQVAGREADLAGFVVHFLDDHADLFAGLEHVGRVRHAIPRELADMDQALDAIADIDERTELADRTDDAVELHSGFQCFEQLGLGIRRLLLDDRPPREHEPPGLGDDLSDQAVERLADHFLEVLDSPGAHEARWHESSETGDLALEAPLVGGCDAGFDDHPGLELRPVFDGDGTVGKGHVVEAVVIVAGPDRHLDRVADRREIKAGIEEPGEFHGTLAATAEVDERRVGSDREHGRHQP